MTNLTNKYIGMIEDKDGDAVYISLLEGNLVGGFGTKHGHIHQYVMEYDSIFSLDENLQEFVEYIEGEI